MKVLLKNLNYNSKSWITNPKNAKDMIKGSELMIKKIAWDTFKNTGDVNTFLELKQIQNIEEQIQVQKAEQNGNDKNEWNNNFWK